MFKIFNSSDDLKKELNIQRKNKKKIILCHGVFDLLHIGHLKYFNSAKKKADFLVVTVTCDRYVNKGNGRPVFNHFLRAEMIAALEVVDAVYISNFPTSINVINLIRPNIYYKGPDYKNLKNDRTNNIIKEINAVKRFGGIFKTASELVFSSSSLINSEFNIFNNVQKNFLNKISKKYSFDFIYKKIDSFKDKKILLIGETIIDQYTFGEVLGKSGKEPHLVMKNDLQEDYLGGAGAIANHLSDFSKLINFVTIIGQKKEYYSFIKNSLKNNIKTKFFFKKNSPTIVKKRFIDKVSKSKLLGVYSINDEKLENLIEKKINNSIKLMSKNSDLIIISDYGHGMISKRTASFIQSLKKFTALNAQVNAANYGYHSLSKYKKIDILVINENELRHESRDKKSNLEYISNLLINKFNIKILIVTRGSEGSILIRKNSKPEYCPAFANKIVDKVGAGDAMLAIISLCLKLKLPDDLTLFLGSIAASISVESIGNSNFIDKKNFLRQVEYAIK
jgi:rfaE bifunctional protein kinase chain/domain/rfaE bifunctional protein nucleotidyltransferase chain/domain